jgi:hypothetical protein
MILAFGRLIIPKQRVPAKLKRAVIARAQGCCEYCRNQVQFAMQSFSIEHIKPRQTEGETVLDNLALACEGCNVHKHTRTQAIDPASGDIAPLFNPRRQRWDEHFSWNTDSTIIIGLTPVGRATVEALKMNRRGVVNLRRVLCAMGEHPPNELREL